MPDPSTRSAREPAQTQASYRARSGIPWRDGRRGSDPHRGRRRGRILAVLAALACLAGFAMAEVMTSPPWPVTPDAGPGTPRRERPGAVSWPANGVSAAYISGFGVMAGPGATRPVPIASVAKVMTAYVVLHDHPLPAGGSGPDIVVQPPEAAEYSSQARNGDSLVPVVA